MRTLLNNKCLLLFISLWISSCSQGEMTSSKIEVKIPFNETIGKFVYTEKKKTTNRDEQLNFNKAQNWVQNKLNNVSGLKANQEVDGKGAFHFTQQLRSGTSGRDFQIEFLCSIVTQSQQYEYSFSDIVIIQHSALVNTRVTLEEFVRQYQGQSMLNENVVTMVNGILRQIDDQMKNYILDLSMTL